MDYAALITAVAGIVLGALGTALSRRYDHLKETEVGTRDLMQKVEELHTQLYKQQEEYLEKISILQTENAQLRAEVVALREKLTIMSEQLANISPAHYARHFCGEDYSAGEFD